MAEAERKPVPVFLEAVQGQLSSLDPREQREILDELADHLEDTILKWRDAGLDEGSAQKIAAAEMGDPVDVGRRLRHEHLDHRLPLLDAVLAGVPFLALPSIVIGRRLAYQQIWQHHWLEPVLVLLVVGGVLALGLWGLGRGQRYLLAPLAGIVGLIALFFVTPVPYGLFSSAVHALFAGVPESDLSPWLFKGYWAVMALLYLPALAAVVRWGRLPATLAVLGGFGVLTLLPWTDVSLSWSLPAFMLVPYLALVAVAAAPRRWQTAVAWMALLADWVVYRLSSWVLWFQYQQTFGDSWKTPPVTIPSLFFDDWPMVLVVGAVLLLWVQVVAMVSARCVRYHWSPRLRLG